MSKDNVDFETLKAEYIKQWSWFQQNNSGYCFEPLGKRNDDENMRQEFERRQHEFLALVRQMEEMPLPHYFCWAEALFEEHDDNHYFLNPDTLICVRVEGVTKQGASVILGASAYAL